MAERRFTLIFYLALVVAGFATYGVYRVLETTRQSGRIRTVPVVIALADLPEGAQIEKASVSTSEWPDQTVPDGAFRSVDDVVGRVTRVAVFKGEPMVPGRLAPKGTGPGLEVKIAPGKRAMAVRINDVAGLNGLVQPGSRVDMLVTLRDGLPGRDMGGVAKLFMENLKVLSVGSRVTRSEDNAPINATTATLEVTPSEAEQIALAMKEGNIQLVLRGYGDPDSVTTKGATGGDVLARLRDPQLVAALRVREDSIAAAAARAATQRRAQATRVAAAPKPVAPTPAPTLAAAPEKPDSVTVKVYRGGAASQTKFEKADSSGARRPATP